MADLNVNRDDDTIPDAALAGGVAPRVTETDHLLPETTHAAAPGTIAQVDDPELARLQIEQTRARMSETIDQIEETLARKKERIEERMDVMAPVRRHARENPLPMIGGVFLAGLVLGFLTGGDDEDDEPRPAVRRYAVDFDRERAHGSHWEERSRTWERRARRLMDLANRQEAELLALRGEGHSRPRRRRRLFGLRETVEDGLSRGLADAYTGDNDAAVVHDRGYDMPRGGYDGMPLHEADSYPPHDEGYGREPFPAPV
ncbi:MAG TPA: hypothetical protein VFR37_04375 [Longimicrobium sp.]|nr:hypothetical protein [Longimicrobium sp.]